MANIKQQISKLRSNTPKRTQWLLMIAAFIVVLILLTLLLGGKSNKNSGEAVKNASDETDINLILTPDDESYDWSNVPVGTEQTQDIRVSATAPVKILKIYSNKDDIAGFSFSETCKPMGVIDKQKSCSISLKYKPTVATDTPTVSAIFIEWRTPRQKDEMSSRNKITFVMGASGPVAEPEPVSEPEPEPVEPVAQQIQADIETLAPSDPFVDNIDDEEEYDDTDIDIPQPAPKPMAEKPVDNYQPAPEGCSDFAFPGYNSSGLQIGWIKPEHGAYYFHPFSDKDCNKPTGIYNPDNGLITDINNNGKRIGTDAEHIGHGVIKNGTLPQLSNPVTRKKVRAKPVEELDSPDTPSGDAGEYNGKVKLTQPTIGEEVFIGSGGDSAVYSTQPYDRRFILRQYKPIPATIVSEVRADPSLYDSASENIQLPVRATVDRNVYADNGRTIIIPTGTLMLGYVTGEIPGPYTAVGRMQIKWYQFILPNGVEFNFNQDQDPFSADSQGRAGVPGHGSTDYLEQFVMPMITAIVPAAVNMIAPVADKFVNQIDLDNNTVVQSGTMRSSELAKNEIITAWNQVAQKLMVDMMDKTVPPFSIAAGTRITVYSPEDLIVNCAEEGKACHMASAKVNTKRRPYKDLSKSAHITPSDEGWVGQVRSFDLGQYCTAEGKVSNEITAANCQAKTGYDYRTLLFYCQSSMYKAKNQVRQEIYYQNQQEKFQEKYGSGEAHQKNETYNQEVLGLKYDDEGAIVNPFAQPVKENAEYDAGETLLCPDDGSKPDANGCCTGETYTDMGDQGFNCCPAGGGDCFPPLI